MDIDRSVYARSSSMVANSSVEMGLERFVDRKSGVILCGLRLFWEMASKSLSSGVPGSFNSGRNVQPQVEAEEGDGDKLYAFDCKAQARVAW